MSNTLEAGLRSNRLDIVTIVFQQEIFLLKLQAISIQKCFQPQDINRIFIVVNELAPEVTYSALSNEVLPEYGDLISKIEIIPAHRLMRPHVAASGWITQQALKLLAARIVSTDFYMVLDAKNHFVQPVSLGTFLDTKSGKARSNRIRKHGSLDTALEGSLEYFGVSRGDYSLPATTPFLLKTVIVRQMIEFIEDREGIHFDDFMVKQKNSITEFFLYNAYLMTLDGGIESVYRFGPRVSGTLFRRSPNTAEGVDALLDALVSGALQTFGIHRERVHSLTHDQWSRICGIWVSAGLFPGAHEAAIFVERLKSKTVD